MGKPLHAGRLSLHAEPGPAAQGEARERRLAESERGARYPPPSSAPTACLHRYHPPPLLRLHIPLYRHILLHRPPPPPSQIVFPPDLYPEGIPPEYNIASQDINYIQVPMSAQPEGMKTVLIDAITKRAL